MEKELHQSYQVADGEVTLTVVIGEGQWGNSLVYLDDHEVPESVERPGRWVLGRGAEIAGKVVAVESTVTDVRKQSNRTSITYALEGGAERRESRLEAVVEHAGDAVDYYATFRLTR